MEKSRRLANKLNDANYERDSIRANIKRRINPRNDYVVNVGKDVYGIFNSEHISLGYHDRNYINRIDILHDNNIQHFECKDMIFKTNNFNILAQDKITVNGMLLNKELLDGMTLTKLSANAKELLKRIHNLDITLPVLTDQDFEEVPIFKSSANKTLPALNSIKLPQFELNRRKDLLTHDNAIFM